MDITNTSPRPMGVAADSLSEEGKNTPREPLRLDAASWVALAAFVAYIGVGLLA